MEDDLRRYHGIAPERVRGHRMAADRPVSTAAGRAPRTTRSLARHGLDPARPLVLVAGNTPSNAPYEGRFVERLVEWWRSRTSAARPQLLFRPHPRDRDWRERFGGRRGSRGRRGAGARASRTSRSSPRSSSTWTSSSATRARSSSTRSSATVRPSASSTTRERRPASRGPRRTSSASTTRSSPPRAPSIAPSRFEEVVAGIERALGAADELAAGAAPGRPSRSSARSTATRPSASSTPPSSEVLAG